MELDLPGVDPGSIDLDVERSVLTVRAERKPAYGGNTDTVTTERPAGTFSRQLFLGETLDIEKIGASCEAGALGVTSFGEVGDPSDPTCHDALAHHVVPGADHLVCSAIHRPGYRLGDRLLRPARVEVTGPPSSARPARGRDQDASPPAPADRRSLPVARD
ncbi:Protein GrpE [Streptomyces sp. enrichment culture]